MNLNEVFEVIKQVPENEILNQYEQETDPLRKEFLRALFNYKLGINQIKVLEQEKYGR